MVDRFFITKIYFFGSKIVGKTVHIKSRFIDYFSKTEHLHIFGKTPDFFNPSLPSPGVAAAALILEQRRRGWRSQFNYISTMVHSMEDLNRISIRRGWLSNYLDLTKARAFQLWRTRIIVLSFLFNNISQNISSEGRDLIIFDMFWTPA